MQVPARRGEDQLEWVIEVESGRKKEVPVLSPERVGRRRPRLADQLDPDT